MLIVALKLNKIMKNLFKTIALALVLLTSTSAFAQREGMNEAGVNFGYQAGSNGMSNVGIGIKYGIMPSNNLRFELGGMYYFKGGKFSDKITGSNAIFTSKSTDWFDLNLNAHYLFDLNSRFSLYPIFGFTGMFGKTSFNTIKDLGLTQEEWDKLYQELQKEGYDKNFKKDGGYSDHHTRFGVNLGFGCQYAITDDFAITLEAKYKLIKDFGNFNLMLGCAVLF